MHRKRGFLMRHLAQVAGTPRPSPPAIMPPATMPTVTILKASQTS